MPKDALGDVATKDLEAELERRKKKSNKPPRPLEKPDFTKLHAMILQGVHTSFENEHQDEDFEHFVYEEAMEAVYGKDYWNWRNAQGW
jgi:hypothetical protein